MDGPPSARDSWALVASHPKQRGSTNSEQKMPPAKANRIRHDFRQGIASQLRDITSYGTRRCAAKTERVRNS